MNNGSFISSSSLPALNFFYPGYSQKVATELARIHPGVFYG